MKYIIWKEEQRKDKQTGDFSDCFDEGNKRNNTNIKC